MLSVSNYQVIQMKKSIGDFTGNIDSAKLGKGNRKSTDVYFIEKLESLLVHVRNMYGDNRVKFHYVAKHTGFVCGFDEVIMCVQYYLLCKGELYHVHKWRTILWKIFSRIEFQNYSSSSWMELELQFNYITIFF